MTAAPHESSIPVAPPPRLPPRMPVKVHRTCEPSRTTDTPEVAANRMRTPPLDIPGSEICFVDKLQPVLVDLRRMGMTRAMRVLDSLRKHSLTADEVELLGMNGRLDIQDRVGLMTLCGCRRGARLTAAQMKTVYRTTKHMEAEFQTLESLFEALAPIMRKISTGSEEERGQAEPFLEAAKRWLVVYSQAQELVRTKQADLRRGDDGFDRSFPKGADQSLLGDKLASPYPEWLTVLLNSYNSERLSLQSHKCCDGALPAAVPDSIARFSIFLGRLFMVQHEAGAVTAREKAALAVLLDASFDGSGARSSAPSIASAQDDSVEARIGSGSGLSRTMRYWTKRFFVFMLSIRELRSVSDRSVDDLRKMLELSSVMTVANEGRAEGKHRSQHPELFDETLSGQDDQDDQNVQRALQIAQRIAQQLQVIPKSVGSMPVDVPIVNDSRHSTSERLELTVETGGGDPASAIEAFETSGGLSPSMGCSGGPKDYSGGVSAQGRNENRLCGGKALTPKA